MKFERLFSPITINGMALKNRLVMPALHHLYTPDGYATDRFNQYYWRRAEGGVALIIVGGCAFDDCGGAEAMVRLSDDSFIPGYREFTDGCHARGAKVAAQLYHAGAYTRASSCRNGAVPLAPSAVYSSFSRQTPKEMTEADMDRVISDWAAGALRARQAGFDAVEIIASAGYLISQFLSPIKNLRTDAYGGSFENRCRFPLRVIRAVRGAVGPDYPVMIRIAGNDFVPGSNDNHAAVRFARAAAEAGVDLISVTGGFHETKVPQLSGDVSRAGFTYLSGAVKQAVSVPVMASNRINDPLAAETVLALGRADLIGAGRALVADPDWCRKAQEGRAEDIRHCVACNQGCLAKTFFGKPIECLVNAEAGQEYRFKDRKPGSPKRIVVVGAGPAGCEFAIRATQLGHRVTVWEKQLRIGGQLHLAAAAPAKSEFATLIGYYEAHLRKLGIPVELGREATPELLARAECDAVVVASGSAEKRIPLPITSGRIPILMASQVLSGAALPGKNVVVVGGGAVGCETAQLMARQGSLTPEELYFLMSANAETPEFLKGLLNRSDRAVHIVELTDRIGSNFEPGTGWPVLNDLRRLGVRLHTLASVAEVREDAVLLDRRIADPDTAQERVERVSLPCDTIVMAVGSVSDPLYDRLKGTLPAVYSLGDCSRVGKVSDAVRQAMELAYSV